jgi:hypothetical protein
LAQTTNGLSILVIIGESGTNNHSPYCTHRRALSDVMAAASTPWCKPVRRHCLVPQAGYRNFEFDMPLAD